MNQKRALLTIFLVVFLDLVGFGIVIPLFPYYAKTFGTSPKQLGYLLATYSALQFLFSPVWGQLSDKWGRRPILLASIAGGISALLILANAHAVWMLFLGRALAGVFGANISAASAYIADITDEHNRAKGMGIIGASFGLGFIFGPAIGGILSRHSFVTPMYVAAGLSTLNLIFAYFYLKEPPISQDTRQQNRIKRFSKAGLKLVFADGRTRTATLTFFLLTLAITQMETMFGLYMLEKFGLSAEKAGYFFALMGLVMAIIQGGLIGKLSKRFGEINLITMGCLLLCTGYIGFSYAYSLIYIQIFLCVIAVGSAITNPSLSSLASKGAAENTKGLTLGIYQSASSLARVIGPVMAGYLYQTFSMTTPFRSSGLIAFFAGVLVSIWRIGSTEAMTNALAVLKTDGFKGLIKRYGWRVAAAVFVYYLVRDVTLYVALPWLIAKGFLH